MAIRSLCAVVLLALWVPLACSSDDGDDAGGGNSGGSSGSGGSGGGATPGDAGSGPDAGGGQAGGDSTGSGGAAGTNTAGGAAGSPTTSVACGENDGAATDCENVGDLCANSDRCCRCIAFPGAPSCGLLWTCATPENSALCPENPPTAGDPCTTINTGCQYCLDDGPHFFSCSRIAAGSDEGQWNEGEGLSCNE